MGIRTSWVGNPGSEFDIEVGLVGARRFNELLVSQLEWFFTRLNAKKGKEKPSIVNSQQTQA